MVTLGRNVEAKLLTMKKEKQKDVLVKNLQILWLRKNNLMNLVWIQPPVTMNVEIETHLPKRQIFQYHTIILNEDQGTVKVTLEKSIPHVHDIMARGVNND